MYALESDEKFLMVRGEIDATLRSEEIYRDKSDRAMSNYQYESVASKLLDDNEYGEPFAQFITAILMQSAEGKRLGGHMLMQHLASLVFKKFPRQSLDRVAEYIERSELKGEKWTLSHVIAAPFSFSGKREGPLFEAGDSVVVDACRRFPRRFAPLVAEIAPLFEVDEGRRTWTQIGRALLDEFGNRKEMLAAMVTNMQTGDGLDRHSLTCRASCPRLRKPLATSAAR